MNTNTHLQALTHAVYEHPADLSRRLVLSDALLEVGDPRGEFIALQFETSARSRKRAAKLLARHRASWLGPLLGVVVDESEVWRHGFPVSAVMQFDGSLVDAPELSTIESMWVMTGWKRTKELHSKWLTSLRSIRVVFPRSCSESFNTRAALEIVRTDLQKVNRLHLLKN